MGEHREYQARTLEVALSKASRDLGVPLESVRYELVFDGRRGLFGFGQKDVSIRVNVGEMEKTGPQGVGPVGSAFPQERRQLVKSPATGQATGPGPHRADHSARPPRHDAGRGRRRDTAENRHSGGRAAPADREGRTPNRLVQASPDHRSAGAHEVSAPVEGPPALPPETPQGKALLQTGQKLIGLMGFDLECVVQERVVRNGRPEEVVLEMRGPDDRLIIGRHGEVLDAFQYVVSLMFGRDKSFDDVRVAVDCAGYRHRHDQDLEARAQQTADGVRRTGEAVQLEPMNPYQRRIVHMALRDEPGVKTFSTGEGFLRRLTIGPS